MNERIRELAEQATTLLWNVDHTESELDVEQFTKLIVNECCAWIDGSPSTEGGQLLLSKSFIIATLKGHFGVE